MEHKKIELVIFDKDGTLIDFNFMWAVWAEELVSNVNEQIGEDISKELFELLGYDASSRTVVSGGLLCCTPMGSIRSVVKSFLVDIRRLNESRVETILNNYYKTPVPTEKNVKTRGNLKELFRYLKEEHGYKLAICTTDDVQPTQLLVEREGLSQFVDIILGGDMDSIKPKPSAEQIEYICNKLRIKPSATVLIGDTNTDMKMGKAANVLLTIGVLHGSNTTEDLEEYADILVSDLPRVKRVFDLLLA